MKVFWLDVFPIDPATGNEVPYYFTTDNHSRSTGFVGGITYLPYLESYPKTEISVFEGEFLGKSEIKIDSLRISQGDISILQWPNYVWDGARVRLYKGYDDSPTRTQIFDGVVSTAPAYSEGFFTINLEDHSYKLDVDNMSLTYAGTGGIEGPLGMKGVYKPLPIGFPLNVEPVFIDPAFGCFQYCGYGECGGVVSLWENGLSFGAATAVVPYAGSVAATYTNLKNVVLTVGQWADAPSIGCFRVGGEPKQGGVITCDLNGLRNVGGGYTYETLAQVLTYFITVAGEASRIETSSLNNVQTATNAKIADYFLEPEKVEDIVEKYMKSVGGYVTNTSDGLFKFALVRMAPSPIWFLSDPPTRGDSPVVEAASLLPVSAPFKEVNLGYDKTFRVHNSGEISDALYQAFLAQDIRLDQLEIDVNTVETTLGNIGADNVLSRVEKQVVIANKKQLDDEYTAIINRATAWGITTEKTDYTTYYNALGTYLNTLSPAWNLTTQDTPIDRAVFKTKWADTYYRRQLLVNALTARARYTNRGQWATATVYNLGDLFLYQGSSFEVITAHTSSGSVPDFTKTNLLASAGNKADLIFIRSNTTPATPTGDSPAGWSLTGVPAGTAQLWMSKGLRDSVSNAVIGSWGVPSAISGITLLGAYNATTTYLVTQSVTYNGGTYVATTTTTGNAPTGTAQANAYWDVIAAPGAAGTPATPPSGFSATLNLTSGAAINLRSVADANGYTGNSNATITFNVPNGVTIRGLGSGANGGIGIDTGSWPTGTYTIALTLVIQSGGIVDGGGGRGGNGGGQVGGSGGDAIYVRLNMTGGITINSGGIARGGGGGGAGSRDGRPSSSSFDGTNYWYGGGGGGGAPNGPGGTTNSPTYGPGSAGTTAGGGAGGPSDMDNGFSGSGMITVSAGGNGGGYATAGVSQAAGGGSYAGGAAGKAVNKNGFTVTVTNNGTMTGEAS